MAFPQRLLSFVHDYLIVKRNFCSGKRLLASQIDSILVTQFDPLREEPDAALLAVFRTFEKTHPQFGLDWLVNLARTALAPDERAVIYIAREPDGQLAALPLILTGSGRSLRALGNFYTTIFSPVCNTPEPGALFHALLRDITRNLRPHSIHLAPMERDSPLFADLQAALAGNGWRGIHSYFCLANWSHSLGQTSWESYLASRASKVRNTVTRRTRKFLADGNGTLCIVSGGPELEDAIDQFTQIYNSSWKQPEPYPEFMPGLLRLAARKGWLRLGIAAYGGRPVASQVWLVTAKVAYIFKLAYHADFASLSPGTVLSAHMMAHVIDCDGVEKIDYLSGDDAYKQDWMSERAEYRGIAAYNPASLQGALALACHWLKLGMKKLGVRRGNAVTAPRYSLDQAAPPTP